MFKKKLSLLVVMAITVSVLSAGFSKELVVYAKTSTTMEEVKQTYSDRVYLSDLDCIKASAYGTVKNDANSSGAKIKLKVNNSYITFKKGLFAHASSDVIYNVESQISEGFDTFIAYAGVDASQGGKGNVKFILSVSEDNITWTQIKITDAVTSLTVLKYKKNYQKILNILDYKQIKMVIMEMIMLLMEMLLWCQRNI